MGARLLANVDINEFRQTTFVQHTGIGMLSIGDSHSSQISVGSGR